jgi:hypothetical protein
MKAYQVNRGLFYTVLSTTTTALVIIRTPQEATPYGAVPERNLADTREHHSEAQLKTQRNRQIMVCQG